jgi:Icc-related predicted phosphoesterase
MRDRPHVKCPKCGWVHVALPSDSAELQQRCVVTHHAPSARSLRGDYTEGLTPAMYASDLEPLVLAYQPELWLHGHVHRSSDYMIGAARVVCNPRGYFGHEVNPEFRWGKLIEVTARPRAEMKT